MGLHFFELSMVYGELGGGDLIYLFHNGFFLFSHVNRECNTLADILGEDGASRASLVFDV